MFLHNIEFDKFSIVREDTLLSLQHWDDQPFELIVSNPPFSVPWEGDKNPLLINDPRFSPAGVLAPASKGDMAFIMHSLVAGFQRCGGHRLLPRHYVPWRAEQKKSASIWWITTLWMPSFSCPQPVLKCHDLRGHYAAEKNKTDNAVLFVDASKEFVKVTKNNRLSDANIRRIVSAVAERKDEQHFAHLVPNDEVGSKAEQL